MLNQNSATSQNGCIWKIIQGNIQDRYAVRRFFLRQLENFKSSKITEHNIQYRILDRFFWYFLCGTKNDRVLFLTPTQSRLYIEGYL